jgi:hypothetical protein
VRREAAVPVSSSKPNEGLLFPSPLPSTDELHITTSQEMQARFHARAFALKLNLQALASQQIRIATDVPLSQVLQSEDTVGGALDPVLSAGVPADSPARSVAPLIPLRHAFARLRNALVGAGEARESVRAAPSTLEVEHALDLLQLQTSKMASAERQQHSPKFGHQLHTSEQQPPAAPEVTLAPAAISINDLFTRPALAIIQQQPPRRQRTPRTFDMSKVRRSARLAKKPVVPALERAQRNLWRKLGVSEDELRLVEDILQDFIRSHQAPLPEHIVSAMTALFDLDDEGAELVNDALLQHAGHYLDDFRNELPVIPE